MENYKDIHLWDLPPETQIRIKENLRHYLITHYIHTHKTWRAAAEHLNSTSLQYGLKANYYPGIFGHWRKGLEVSKDIKRSMPLWVTIEMSRALSKNKAHNNEVMKQIESNVDYCTTGSKGFLLKINFPIKLTPELVSIVFHLCGDGHLGPQGQVSHYRQVNPQGLENFSQKLHNCFGSYDSHIFEESKAIIPKTISNLLRKYFELNSCYWDVARISSAIKELPNEYLLAGLTAFIIDEGHIGETIEVYSGNKKLLHDIREIIDKLGYVGYGPKIKKQKKGKEYRVYISMKSATQLYNDIQVLKKRFPTCGLAHKEHLLAEIVERQKRNLKKRPDGETQNRILSLLSDTNLNSLELRTKLHICGSTLREHLTKLEAQNKIKSEKPERSCCLIWSKIK